ncbi:hypothetical protein [uncultured Chitinophaga sp.]|jgi:hypothetical protein|uniref:hypothetical protein n=1 Tax=uncultured Chitinophaga sp. TaxID=339340 RepID=UPI002638C75D|nr:hypothetical protein [uncultured Chitinophaga sp.]
MRSHFTRIFTIVTTILVTLTLLPSCSSDDEQPEGPAARIRVKLLNKDCMGVIVDILDPRVIRWGAADYRLDNVNHPGAVWVQQGDQLFANLAVGQEYFIDAESIVPIEGAVCKRGPGPPDKAIAVYKVY